MTSADSYTLYAQKVWQATGPRLFWRVRGPSGKAYLVVDANRHDPGVYIVAQKPDGASSAGALVNLLRKYCRTAAITSVRQTTRGFIILPLQPGKTQPPKLLVYLTSSRPPKLGLITPDGTILAEQDERSTRTKRRLADESLRAELEAPGSEMLADIVNQTSITEPSVSTPETLRQPLSLEQRELRKRLVRRRKTVRKSLAKLKTQTPNNEQIAQLKIELQLLQQHLHNITPGQTSLTIDTSTGPLTLAIDPDISPGKNLDRCFHKLKKMTAAMANGERQIVLTQAFLDELETMIAQLATELKTQQECEEIAIRFGLGTRQGQRKRATGPLQSMPYREFRSSSGVVLRVGKTAADNDRLTRQSKSHHYWFHIVGQEGSHVVALSSIPDETTRREAAMLALHYSKARLDRSGEVYFTARRHLKKTKGMAVGMWNITQAQTIYINYEENEISTLLASRKELLPG